MPALRSYTSVWKYASLNSYIPLTDTIISSLLWISLPFIVWYMTTKLWHIRQRHGMLSKGCKGCRPVGDFAPDSSGVVILLRDFVKLQVYHDGMVSAYDNAGCPVLSHFYSYPAVRQPCFVYSRSHRHAAPQSPSAARTSSGSSIYYLLRRLSDSGELRLGRTSKTALDSSPHKCSTAHNQVYSLAPTCRRNSPSLMPLQALPRSCYQDHYQQSTGGDLRICSTVYPHTSRHDH